MRYHLSIHNIHQTHLEDLDMLAQRFLKKWLGLPSRGCTNLSLFHPHLLNIRPVSQLYLQGHIGNFINSKLKADHSVNAALESSIHRESQWSRKSSTVVACKDTFEEIAVTEHIPTASNCMNVAVSRAIEVPNLKKKADQIIAEKYRKHWNAAANDLTVQGEFVLLLAEENNDITWQAYKYSVPHGVMGFATRAATNSLAIPDNLFRWSKRVDSSCKV